LRCLENVEKGILEMKVKKWRETTVDRVVWASTIKEAKALRGPYSQEASKR
jgi:hypothetical protein